MSSPLLDKRDPYVATAGIRAVEHIDQTGRCPGSELVISSHKTKASVKTINRHLSLDKTRVLQTRSILQSDAH